MKKQISLLNISFLKPHYATKAWRILFLLLSVTCCRCGEKFTDTPEKENVFVPEQPQYDEHGYMWTIIRNDPDGNGADIFYVPSTWEYDWHTADGRICHHADPSLHYSPSENAPLFLPAVPSAGEASPSERAAQQPVAMPSHQNPEYSIPAVQDARHNPLPHISNEKSPG